MKSKVADVTLAECRAVFEWYFGYELPETLPYKDAIEGVIKDIGFDAVMVKVFAIRRGFNLDVEDVEGLEIEPEEVAEEEKEGVK